ncbi:helicase-associated domain-containing protein [Microtetraspora glauca]|uniref:Helicase-associated domain-containing protein n=1 Tax=Microtetraspora glauca TaxID=1996 RepID=A0ABV3GRR0_MICGL
MDDHLTGWLATLDEERLTRVLGNRPDALAPPWPRRLDALAERLSGDFAVMEVMRTLPLPALEIVQACLALGGRPGEDELARFLGVSVSETIPWLDRLYDHALAWPAPDGRIALAGALARWWTAPCGLGEPLSAYLESWTLNTEGLRRMCRNLGISAQGTKRQLMARVSATLGDSELLSSLVADAPEGTIGMLDDFAWDGPIRSVNGDLFITPGTPEKWALDRGLLFRTQWGVAGMPREVALALRGPDYHAPFTPYPPDLATVPVDVAAVEHEMCLAAPHLLDRATALLENIDKSPLPLLKGGGVGVREVKRVAKETGCTEEEVRLLIETSAVSRLIMLDEDTGGLVPTDRFDTWRLSEGPARLRVLLAAWWRMERSSLRRVQDRYATVLGDDPEGETIARTRRAVIGALSEIPEGRGFATFPELVQSVHWQAPLLDRELLAECAPAVLEEARLLGLFSNGAPTSLGRALAALGSVAGAENDGTAPEVEHDPALAERSAKALASAQRTALFGADLTAVVTGPPSAELASLLDRAADRESRGAASVWRFGPASVRRALDGGETADTLLDQLAEVGALPQPLVYLVRDVARRHGEVTVASVGCVILGSDPTLLTEISAHRKLARLGLRSLAPTVLASQAPADRTLAALRDVGYAPVPDGAGGITIRRDLHGRRPVQAGTASRLVTASRIGAELSPDMWHGASRDHGAAPGQGAGPPQGRDREQDPAGGHGLGRDQDPNGEHGAEGERAADRELSSEREPDTERQRNPEREQDPEPLGGRLILLPGGRTTEPAPSPPPPHTPEGLPSPMTGQFPHQLSDPLSGPLPDPPPDPREHARRLIVAGRPAQPGDAGRPDISGQPRQPRQPRQPGDRSDRAPGRTWAVIGRLATRLPTAQQTLLGFVVDRGVRALITLSDGVTATISHGELRGGGILDAWCEEAGDYLDFPLSEITSVVTAH